MGHERRLPCGGFFLQQSDRPLVAVAVLLHGFLGNSEHMRPLAEFFCRQGYSALCPNLPGHGTKPEDLIGVRFSHFLQTLAPLIGAIYHEESERVQKSFWKFTQHHPLVLCGYSLGGTTAVRLATCFPGCNKRLITISTPMDWISIWERFVPVVASFKPWLSKPPCQGDYDLFPTRSVGLLHEAVCEARKNAHEVKCPTFIIHAEDDPLVSVSHAETLRSHLKHVRPKVLLRKLGGHAIPKPNRIFGGQILGFLSSSS